MSQYGMVIDLRKCVGCGACSIACKMENNTEDRVKGQTHNWSDYYTKTTGDFPNSDYTFLPVLCNHCTDAPCIAGCLGQPQKALYKSADGVTLFNATNCIGCRQCQTTCPYSVLDVDESGDQYSVNSFNFLGETVHPFWRNTEELIAGCTATGDQVASKAGSVPPDWNDYQGETYNSVRSAGKMEKCILCHHRLIQSDDPYCVASCPTGARVSGDLDNPMSEVRQLLGQYTGKRLKNNKGEFLAESEAGTRPNVYYIRKFKTD